MNPEKDYIKINKQSWNARTDAHLESEFYDLEGFLKGESSLHTIELDLLGEIKGKSILHLQCHFGQDTISLARMGGDCTGVDFSDKAVARAKVLSEKTGVQATFVCCDLYEAPKYINGAFDIVFTSYGTIGWLPDLNKWAAIISGFLKPGGTFVFAEFHPVVWMFDDHFTQIKYPYFKTAPIIEDESGTYADRDADIHFETVTWNHSIGEVVSSLLQNGLGIQSFKEYDYSPYDCFHHTEEFEPKKFRIKHFDNKLPMVYSVVAKKSSVS